MKKWAITVSLLVSSVLFSAAVNAKTSMNSMHQELNTSMMKMHSDMHDGMMEEDPDLSFAKGMLAHHIGAIDMARIELKYGNDPEMRALAEKIIKAQDAEIKQMKVWIEQHKEKKVKKK